MQKKSVGRPLLTDDNSRKWYDEYMVALNIVPEGSKSATPADARTLRLTLPSSHQQEPSTNEKDLLMERLNQSVISIKESNPQSPYLSQLNGLKTAIDKGSISLEEATQAWFEISAQAGHALNEYKDSAQTSKKEGISTNPLSRLLRSIFT